MLFEKTVNHIAIICTDIDASLRFYTQKLGFTVREKIDREDKANIIYLNAGDSIIELFHFPDAPQRPSYPESAGLRHIAFSTRTFDETLENLRSKGVEHEPERLDERTGKRMTFIFDPDKLPIEISEI